MPNYNNSNDNNTNIVLATYGDISIYKDDIEILEEDYINTLLDPEDIKKTSVFSGLLNHLYINLFCNIVKANSGSNSNAYDYIQLDKIFNNIYLPLVCKYNKTPTIQSFCFMTGLNNQALSEVIAGTYTNTGKPVNAINCQTAKRWKATCEAALIDKAFNDNGIGAIFGLKAAHGWTDQQTQKLEIVSGTAQATPEQIAERYSAAEKPELPELD